MPLTHRGFQNRINKVEKNICAQYKNTASHQLHAEQVQRLQQSVSEIEKQIQDIKQLILETERKNELTKNLANTARRNSMESVWAAIFNQTIYGSEWLKNPSFSSGRWAVGYPYLYALYRILNEVHPKQILELGLGQTTKMISQYAAAFPNVVHQVVEHDPEWIAFFTKICPLPENTEIIRLDREFITYKDAEKVRAFKGFQEKFKGQQFDFISIDAPLGADMKQYSRIDVLNMMPEILFPDFILMIDDYNRHGEQNTVKEMEKVLTEHQIEYAQGKYSGEKDCFVLAAKKYKFVCSM